jgi:hypothetical protein
LIGPPVAESVLVAFTEHHFTFLHVIICGKSSTHSPHRLPSRLPVARSVIFSCEPHCRVSVTAGLSTVGREPESSSQRQSCTVAHHCPVDRAAASQAAEVEPAWACAGSRGAA